MGRSDLRNAQKAKRDEFYTQLEDIANELKYYRKFFEGKTVLCNCDDPFESNFFKYFAMNFNFLKLKKLICTCYAGSPVSYEEFKDLPIFQQNTCHEKLPYVIQITEVADINNDGAIDMEDVLEILLKNENNNLSALDGDGDFRSSESIVFLEEADVVVTNPPFSLFREYMAQLMKYKKKFLILSNQNALTYKEFFPLVQSNQVWVGYGFNMSLVFRTPYENKLEANRKFVAQKGYDPDFYIKTPAICWFTNIDIDKRHEELILYKNYTPDEYPKYDNYDAINVDHTADIPADYFETMGVPITFLDKYNPDQFEILGLAPERKENMVLRTIHYENGIQHNADGSTGSGNKVNDGPTLLFNNVPDKYPYYTCDNREGFLRVLYARILIRRKQ